MRNKTQTSIIRLLRASNQALSKISKQMHQASEKVAQIEAIQCELLQILIEIIEKPKSDQITSFLKAVKHLQPIPDQLIKRLAVIFNCNFKMLKFQIEWNAHSEGFNDSNHQENI